MIDCWLAVDKDGTEKVSNTVFIRRAPVKYILWGTVKVRYSKNAKRKWANMWSSDEADSLPFNGTILPKGTIEKILGRKLTWDDEPVKI